MNQEAYSRAVFYIAGLDKRYKVNRRVGWVYAAHNPFLGKSVVKIGMSGRPPAQRASELERSTGYEGPFRLAYFVHVSDRVEAEKFVHRSLDRHRVRSWEEFFELPLSVAVRKLDEVAAMYPLSTAHPGSFPVEAGTGVLPQVFTKRQVVCPQCSTANQVHELAIPVRVSCSKCGKGLAF